MVKSLHRKIRRDELCLVPLVLTVIVPTTEIRVHNSVVVIRSTICYKGRAVFRLVTVALLMLGARALFGGVTLDGSFGTHGALPGPNFMISANLGKQVGSNLFQSFSQFNLINTESATFTGPSNIQNILSRVTGGS